MTENEWFVIGETFDVLKARHLAAERRIQELEEKVAELADALERLAAERHSLGSSSP